MPKKKQDPCYGSLCLRPYLKPPKRTPASSITGDVRAHLIPSELLGEREILVYLPPGYSQRDNWGYPYALLHDGQNVFDAKSAVFGIEWSVDETAELLIAEQMIEPVILVAIYNSPNRIAEYTPFPDSEHGGGQGPIYKAFLTRELIPFLEKTYSVSRLPEQRAVIGSSLGGLASLYLAWTAPEVFGCAGVLSPSLWWGKRSFITSMAGDEVPQRRPHIWLDAGTTESSTDTNNNGVPDLIDDLRTLRAILHYHGYRENEDLIYREIEGATHDEASWSQRVGDVLKYFFPKRVLHKP